MYSSPDLEPVLLLHALTSIKSFPWYPMVFHFNNLNPLCRLLVVLIVSEYQVIVSWISNKLIAIRCFEWTLVTREQMGLSLLQGVMCVCSGAFSSTLCDPMDCNLPGSSVHEISQARILEWVAISYSVGIDPGMDQESLKGLYHSLNPWWCFPCGICHGWCGLKYFLIYLNSPDYMWFLAQ